MVIAVFSGIAFATVAGRQDYVHHFSRGDEMNHLVPVPRSLNELGEESLHGCSHHRLSLGGIHTVGMELDEEPVGSVLNRNRSFLPEPEPAQTGRIRPSQGRILEATKSVARVPVKIEHQRTLYIERKDLRGPTHRQIPPRAVRSLSAKWKAALVQRVHLSSLCRVKWGSRQGEIGIASSIRENLHLIINAASIASGCIRQRIIAMDKCVVRLVGTVHETKRSMIDHQGVAKFHQPAASIFRGVGCVPPVMQVNFNSPPPAVTVLGNAVDQTAVVLFGRIEVSMYQGPPFLVTPPIDGSRIFGTPVFHPALLFRKRCTGSTVFGHNGRLDMIGKSDDQMHLATRSTASKPLPGITG